MSKSHARKGRLARRIAMVGAVAAIGVGIAVAPSVAAVAAPAKQQTTKSAAAKTSKPSFANGSQLTVVNSSSQLVFVETQSYIHRNIQYKHEGAILHPGESMKVSPGVNDTGKPDFTGTLLYQDKTHIQFHGKTPKTIGYPWMGLGDTRGYDPVWDMPKPQFWDKVKSFACGETQSLTDKGKTVSVTRATNDPIVTDFTMHIK